MIWFLLGVYLGGAFVMSFTVTAVDRLTGERSLPMTLLAAMCWPLAITLLKDRDL